MYLHTEHVKKKNGDIDLGLAALSVVSPRGRWWTAPAISAACNCSPQRIDQIEKLALQKLRMRVKHDELLIHLMEEVASR